MSLREPAYYRAKEAAYAAVKKARRLGQLIPEPCEVCGDPQTEGHHRWGYEGDNALRVVWLCGVHHAQDHERMRHEAKGETQAPCLEAGCGSAVWASPDSTARYCSRHMLEYIEAQARAWFAREVVA